MESVVVIPAYNEESALREVIRKSSQYVGKIYVVDDGSKDNTAIIAKEEGATTISHLINMGKGTTLRTGCDFAFNEGAKRIVVLDADGQHNPEKIPEFLTHLNDHDIVFGYRQLSKEMPFVLRFGNWVINKTVATLYGIKLKDTQCGYRSFNANVYRKIRWHSSDYCMESEMIARAGRKNLAYAQIPIKTVYMDRYKGTTILDGIKIVYKMLLWRL